MKKEDLYTSAHLFVAAIRVCEHRNATQPSVNDVCGLLSLSLEKGNHICKKLQEFAIIERVEGAYGTRLFIKDHLKIEDIPSGEKETSLEDALKKFQDSRKVLTQKVESIQAAQAAKKKNLFAEMEKKLKKELDKKES